MNTIYKWTVFAYITTSMVLYLGGFWPFTQNIFDKSWLVNLPAAARYSVASIILACCLALFLIIMNITFKMRAYDPYILLANK